MKFIKRQTQSILIPYGNINRPQKIDMLMNFWPHTSYFFPEPMNIWICAFKRQFCNKHHFSAFAEHISWFNYGRPALLKLPQPNGNRRSGHVPLVPAICVAACPAALYSFHYSIDDKQKCKSILARCLILLSVYLWLIRN